MEDSRLLHYEIVRKLGQGGMGEVHLARDTKLGREVALKLLRPEFARDEERRQRFEREARAAAAVTHPNIATIYEVGESEGRLFIAMEYVRGQSLRQRLQQPLGLDEALRISAEIARGLGKAHAADVIHRDLKPDNVMLDEEGHVRLLDFGLAKLRAPQPAAAQTTEEADTASALITEDGRVLGTPGYMSPEQAAGKPVDYRTDIFSLGVMIYEMVTGARPFVGESLMEIVAATLRDEPVPIASFDPAAGAALDPCLAGCLAKAPAARHQSVVELAGLLESRRQQLSSAIIQAGGAPGLPAASSPPTAWAETAPAFGPATMATSVEPGFADFEVKLFALARDGVELTVANVVARLGVAPAHAEQWMERMVAEGRLQREAPLGTGATLYGVPGLTVRGPAGWLGAARHHGMRLLKLDPSVPASLPAGKQKSIVLGAILGGLMPGVGLVYAAPFWTMVLVLIAGGVGIGLAGSVPLVGSAASSLATLLFALVSAVLGGVYTWHYNRNGKRLPLRAIDYSQRTSGAVPAGGVLPSSGSLPPPGPHPY